MARQLIVAIAESAQRRLATTKKQPHRQSERMLANVVVMMPFGVKPIAPVLWKRDNFWLYGVVEPLSGWHFCQEYVSLNTNLEIPPRACFQSLYLPVCCEEDPPGAPGRFHSRSGAVPPCRPAWSETPIRASVEGGRHRGTTPTKSRFSARMKPPSLAPP